MEKKGMGTALTLVISAVVLIVISLVIITIVSGGLGQFAEQTGEQSEAASEASAQAAAINYCTLQKNIGTDNCLAASYGGTSCDDWLADAGGCS